MIACKYAPLPAEAERNIAMTHATLPLDADAPAPRTVRRIAYTIARVVLGLLLVANAPVGTLIQSPPSGPHGDALLNALWHTPYIMVLTKLVELCVGLALLTNRFVPLALTVFAPVAVNIIAFQFAFVPQIVPIGIVLVSLSAFIAWENRAAYAALLRATPQSSISQRGAS